MTVSDRQMGFFFSLAANLVLCLDLVMQMKKSCGMFTTLLVIIVDTTLEKEEKDHLQRTLWFHYENQNILMLCGF